MAASSTVPRGPKKAAAGTAQSGSAFERNSFTRSGDLDRCCAYSASARVCAPGRTSQTSSGSPWQSEQPRRDAGFAAYW